MAKPFPILAWNVPPLDMRKWVARGVNTLCGYGLTGAKDALEKSRWAATALNEGLRVIVPELYPNSAAVMFPVDEPDRLETPGSNPRKWDGLPPADIGGILDAWLKTFTLPAGMPIFLSLSGDHITQANRVAYYRAIAAVFASRQLKLIWSEDWYPFVKNAARYSNALKAQAIGVLRQAAPDVPVYSWMETGPQNLKDSPLGRGITAVELRHAYGVVLGAKVDGIGLFSHQFDSKTGAWRAWDSTPADNAMVITEENKKLNPDVPPPPPPPDPWQTALEGRVLKLEQMMQSHARKFVEIEERNQREIDALKGE